MWIRLFPSGLAFVRVKHMPENCDMWQCDIKVKHMPENCIVRDNKYGADDDGGAFDDMMVMVVVKHMPE